MDLILPILLLFIIVNVSCVRYQPVRTCSDTDQLLIMTSSTRCGLHPTLVPLNTSLSHVGQVLQVIPDTATVNRCGGYCPHSAYSCLPTTGGTVNRQVDVMVIMDMFETGVHETLCSSLQVEEHLGCQCDCRTQPDHCNSLAYFDSSSCRFHNHSDI